MDSQQLSSTLKELLGGIILKHKPALMSVFELIGVQPLTEEQREALREIIAAELSESGLTENDEPNQRGLLIEELIDRLGHF